MEDNSQHKDKQNKPHKEHDLGYRDLLSYTTFFRQLIEGYVKEEWTKDLDFDGLKQMETSFILPEYREQESDVLYQVPFQGQTAYLYILVEHQSTVDFDMPFRLFTYLSEVWRHYRKNIPEKDRNRADFRYPPVFSVVLYNGDSAWTAAREMKDMVERGDQFMPYLPNFRYHLVDIGRIGRSDLRKYANALAAVFLLEQGFGKLEEFKERLKEARSFLSEEEEEIIRTVIRWLRMKFKKRGMDASGIKKFETLIKSKEEISMLDTDLDRLKEELMEVGEIKGETRKGQEDILEVLQVRFGSVPETLQQRVKAIPDLKKLSELLKKAILSTDLEDFEQEM